MATLNVSIPEKLKQRFFAAFPDENRSAVVSRLIEQAIDERERRHRGEAAVSRLLTRRSRTRPISTAEVRRILAETRRA